MGCSSSLEIAAPYSTMQKDEILKYPPRYLSNETLAATSLGDIYLADEGMMESDNEECEIEQRSFRLEENREGAYEREFYCHLVSIRTGQQIVVYKSFELEENQIVAIYTNECQSAAALVSAIACFKTKLNPEFKQVVSNM